MSWLAVLLLVVGLLDLGGPLVRPRLLMPPIALLLAVGAAAVAGMGTGWRDLLAIVLITCVGAVWSRLAGSPHRGTAGLALGVLLVGVAGAVVAAPWAPPVQGVFADWLARLPWPSLVDARPERVLLTCGVLVAQGSTANQMVRIGLALTRGGGSHDESYEQAAAGTEQAGRTLRGGRMLGVMERLLIVGMGLAGDYTAAGIVVAAKGLLRFPELQAAAREPVGRGAAPRLGVDALTEYFLVGSFLSWSVAFASLAVARG